MQSQTLAHLGQLYPMNNLTKELFQERSWQDFIIHERTLSFADEKTFCFRAELKEHSEEFGIMVFLHQSNLDKVYEAAKELEAFPPHPNVLSVVHTFRAEVPLYLFTNSEDEASQSETRASLPGQSDAVVVVTRQVPTSTAAHFIEESRSRDGENTERYEAQVWGMVLQVCRGLSHAQKCEPANTLEGLKQRISTSEGNSVVSHLTDKCCEFDLGILIYELLHQPNPFAVRTSLMSRNYTPEELPALPNESSFSAKLQSLVSELFAAMSRAEGICRSGAGDHLRSEILSNFVFKCIRIEGNV
ncbi:putative pseudopodium-enriched atypical kinase 1 [Apostichopus japonicus]|uniref:Putative pseudopodium-enriched atypical kinase 1 n=1 Tax=Stichopus japonicus TaxID=307972 RepID=A0A2G8JIJ8_STIJA|nr:putative pseudopodium-enriched atypical kinase 1 [Apostichopus japonicus]